MGEAKGQKLKEAEDEMRAVSGHHFTGVIEPTEFSMGT
jgi:hypothetical protein